MQRLQRCRQMNRYRFRLISIQLVVETGSYFFQQHQQSFLVRCSEQQDHNTTPAQVRILNFRIRAYCTSATGYRV